jgi:hypothetical protein
LEVRKGKKAKWTETALKGLVREAGKAGISLNQAMTVCCERNWVSFKAEWLKENKTSAERNASVLQGLTRGLIGGGNDVGLLGK